MHFNEKFVPRKPNLSKYRGFAIYNKILYNITMTNQELSEEMNNFQDLLKEVEREEDPVKRGDHLCFLIDQMLGNNPEQKGYMRAEGSLIMLEQLEQMLNGLLSDNTLEMPKRKKFESYASMARDKINNVRLAEKNIETRRQIVRKSQGSFLAGSY